MTTVATELNEDVVAFIYFFHKFEQQGIALVVHVILSYRVIDNATKRIHGTFQIFLALYLPCIFVLIPQIMDKVYLGGFGGIVSGDEVRALKLNVQSRLADHVIPTVFV